MYFACQSIESKSCDQALVGGVNILINPNLSVAFSKLGVLSPNGRCKSFDKDADGYVRSEGCGFVVIKSLEKAIQDKNHIYCVISGISANQDGQSSPSLTMPSTEMQKKVIIEAIDKFNENNQGFYFF